MRPDPMQLAGTAKRGIALVAGLGSVFLGYLLAGFFLIATLSWAGSLGPEPGGNWRPFVHFATHSWLAPFLAGWATLALVLAWLGFAFTERDRGPKRLPVLSGVSVLLAIGGLIGGALDLVLIAILLAVGRHWIF